MKRLFTLLYCIFKAKKIFSISKKKYVIFDCVNSKVLSKFLPKRQTHIISARANKIKIILFNFKTIFFLINNFFQRSLTVNYFIAMINQINPRFVITTIDNSVTFSILSKYFENKIKFIAIQNASRGDFFDNTNNHNKFFYFTNYMGLSEFDLKIFKKKKIKVKNFFSAGSLKSSYYRYFISKKKNNEKKNYDICLVGKTIYRENKFLPSIRAHAFLKLINFLSIYVKKYKKSIVIQSKSRANYKEKKLYESFFKKTNYKISWRNPEHFTSYKNVESSKLVIGTPSTLLREASIYPNTKILCIDLEKKGRQPFSGINYLGKISYVEFEKKLNFLFKTKYNNYIRKLNYPLNYIMQKNNTINYLLNFLN